MCRQCELKPVYEFTNKRKLCRRCFVNYFQKKVLYIIRKFGMIRKGDVIGYKEKNDFKMVVLEDVLKMVAGKSMIKLIKLRSLRSQINGSKLIPSSFSLTKPIKITKSLAKKSADGDFEAYQFRTKRGKLKIAVDSSIDSESKKIMNILIKGKLSDLKECLPVVKNQIKPLYLFLDKEILLYARLKNLKFRKKEKKENKISQFIDKSEKKHPEVKRAIVKGILELYS